MTSMITGLTWNGPVVSDGMTSIGIDHLFPWTGTELLERHSNIVTSLLVVMAKKNEHVFHHCTRVSGYAMKIALSLGLGRNEWEHLVVSALLHDIGKVGISDLVLHKSGSLNDDEWDMMKQHSRNAADILFPYASFQPLLPAILHHHERYDGRGYPDHLSGTDIPLHARIISVADTYDAIITDRPYRAACSHSFACAEITRVAGTQLDPLIVDHFLSIFRSGYWFPSSTGLNTQDVDDNNQWST